MVDVGLRELKKSKLKQAVQTEALRLFAEHGYEHTTVEQIAEAAEISTTTFYRYYTSKEDVLLACDHDSLQQGFEQVDRQAGESIADAVRSVMRRALTLAMEPGKGDLRARIPLIFNLPELRAVVMEKNQRRVELFTEVLADRTGHDPDSFSIRIAGAVAAAAYVETLRYWVDHDGEPDPFQLIDRTLGEIDPALNGFAIDG